MKLDAKLKGSSSNHEFSGAVLASGRVIPWHCLTMTTRPLYTLVLLQGPEVSSTNPCLSGLYPPYLNWEGRAKLDFYESSYKFMEIWDNQKTWNLTCLVLQSCIPSKNRRKKSIRKAGTLSTLPQNQLVTVLQKNRHLSPYRWWLLQTWTQVSARSQLSPSQLHERSLQKNDGVFDPKKLPGRFAPKNIQHGGNLVKKWCFYFHKGWFWRFNMLFFCRFSKGAMTSNKLQMLRISWSWLY